MGLNIGIRMGNLVDDPQLQPAGGSQVARFTLAINRKYKNRDGEWVKKAAFIRCEAWDKGGEMIAQYFQKGDPIIIIEELIQDEWKDKNTGEKRTQLGCRVSRFEWVDGYDYQNHCWPGREKNDGNRSAPARKTKPVDDEGIPAIEGEDDIPF